MGIFKNKKADQEDQQQQQPPPPATPIVTYHLTQSLSGQLTAAPEPPSSSSSSSSSPQGAATYTVTLARATGSRRDCIDLNVWRRDGGSPVGRCRIEVSSGKFALEDCGGGAKLAHAKHGYELVVGKRTVRWVRDEGGLHGGGVVRADGRFRLEEGTGTGKQGGKEVLARFAGCSGGVREFGMMEVYRDFQGEGGEGVDWCGLLVLTAVSVYAREARRREKMEKVKGGWEVVSGISEVFGVVGL